MHESNLGKHFHAFLVQPRGSQRSSVNSFIYLQQYFRQQVIQKNIENINRYNSFMIQHGTWLNSRNDQ